MLKGLRGPPGPAGADGIPGSPGPTGLRVILNVIVFWELLTLLLQVYQYTGWRKKVGPPRYFKVHKRVPLFLCHSVESGKSDAYIRHQ